MGYRNFLQLAMEVYRQVKNPINKATIAEAQQVINDSLLEIAQFQNWNFLLDTYDILLRSTYTIGTVSCNIGSNTVTGSGTTWDTSWVNKRILFQTDNNPKEVVNFTNSTTAILRYPFSGTSNLLGQPYTVYQDEYPIPLSPSRDLLIVNPQLRYRLVKLDRYSLEDRTVWGQFPFGITPTHYSDAGTDLTPLLGDGVTPNPTYQQPKLRFWPPVQTQQNLKLVFWKAPSPLVNSTDTTVLPAEFEEVLILLSTYRLKRAYNVPGWNADHTLAKQLLLQFREIHNTQPAYDIAPEFTAYPYVDPYATDSALGVWPGKIG